MNSVNASTGYASFMLKSGHQPHLIPPIICAPTQILVANNKLTEMTGSTHPPPPILNLSPPALSFMEELQNCLDDASDSLLAAKLSQALQVNTSQNPDPNFKVGDKVLLSTENRRCEYTQKKEGCVAKFMPHFARPYTITRAFPESSMYTLHLPYHALFLLSMYPCWRSTMRTTPTSSLTANLKNLDQSWCQMVKMNTLSRKLLMNKDEVGDISIWFDGSDMDQNLTCSYPVLSCSRQRHWKHGMSMRNDGERFFRGWKSVSCRLHEWCSHMIFRFIYILHRTIFVAIPSWNILWSFVHRLILWVLGHVPHRNLYIFLVNMAHIEHNWLEEQSGRSEDMMHALTGRDCSELWWAW